LKNLNKQNPKNFSHLKYFPGDTGNPFDVILHFINNLSKIPLVLFIILIGVLAGCFTFFNLNLWISLALFVAGDIILLILINRLKISFGPVQSQSFLLFILRVPFIWLPAPINLIFQTIGTFLVFFGFLYEPSTIKTSKREVCLQKDFKNEITFFHLGDIHLEKIGVRENKLLKILKENQPDFILFSGDFLNLSFRENLQAIQSISDLFNQINQISPTYWVTGSPAVDMPDSIKTIANTTHAKWLNNTTEYLASIPIELIGVNCSHNPHKDIQILKSMPRKKGDFFSILLHHSPDLIFEIENQNIDLMLSGHTHGGQVCIPGLGAIFTGSLYGRLLQSGIYQRKNTQLYITRGIGLEGLGAPRVRFFCPPEIIQWKIKF